MSAMVGAAPARYGSAASWASTMPNRVRAMACALSRSMRDLEHVADPRRRRPLGQLAGGDRQPALHPPGGRRIGRQPGRRRRRSAGRGRPGWRCCRRASGRRPRSPAPGRTGGAPETPASGCRPARSPRRPPRTAGRAATASARPGGSGRTARGGTGGWARRGSPWSSSLGSVRCDEDEPCDRRQECSLMTIDNSNWWNDGPDRRDAGVRGGGGGRRLRAGRPVAAAVAAGGDPGGGGAGGPHRRPPAAPHHPHRAADRGGCALPGRRPAHPGRAGGGRGDGGRRARRPARPDRRHRTAAVRQDACGAGGARVPRAVSGGVGAHPVRRPGRRPDGRGPGRGGADRGAARQHAQRRAGRAGAPRRLRRTGVPRPPRHAGDAARPRGPRLHRLPVWGGAGALGVPGADRRGPGDRAPADAAAGQQRRRRGGGGAGRARHSPGCCPTRWPRRCGPAGSPIVLADHEPPAIPVQLVHLEGRRAAARVRAFVDFAAERLRAVLGA